MLFFGISIVCKLGRASCVADYSRFTCLLQRPLNFKLGYDMTLTQYNMCMLFSSAPSKKSILYWQNCVDWYVGVGGTTLQSRINCKFESVKDLAFDITTWSSHQDLHQLIKDNGSFRPIWLTLRSKAPFGLWRLSRVYSSPDRATSFDPMPQASRTPSPPA